MGRGRTRPRSPVACCRPRLLHLHLRRRGRTRMGRRRRLLLSHEPLGHDHLLFGRPPLTCPKFDRLRALLQCTYAICTYDRQPYISIYSARRRRRRYIPPQAQQAAEVGVSICGGSSCISKSEQDIGVMRWTRGEGAYIWVGKEAGRKRSSRHGEKIPLSRQAERDGRSYQMLLA